MTDEKGRSKQEMDAYLARIRKTIADSRNLVSQAELRIAETDRMLEQHGLTREQVMAMKFSDAQLEAVNDELSRRFEFRWSEPTLDINFQLPYARVLADEESQKEDDAEIGAAIRMAILLMTVESQKLNEEGLRVGVWAIDAGTGYSIWGENGEEVESDDDWSGLVHRLELVLPDDEKDLAVIWP